MILILEGVDGSGKTTLSNELCSMGAVPMSVPAKDDEYAYTKWVNEIDDSNGVIKVADRSFISDLVYRIVDEQQRGTLDLLQMILLLQRGDVRIVYCKNNKSYDKAMERGEDNITDKLLHEKISKTYDDVMTMLRKFTKVPVLTYDYESNNIGDIIYYTATIRR